MPLVRICGVRIGFLYNLFPIYYVRWVMSQVYVLLNTEPSQMESVLENIKEIEGVVEAYMVYGIYDICAKVKTETPKKLKGVVKEIRSQENVVNTLTLMVVKQPKIVRKPQQL
jgi:DNA-binding Lrp family transcriptional regulator